MSSRGFCVGKGTITALIASSLLFGNGCSGDNGDVSFDPIGGATGKSGNTNGGSNASAGTNSGGISSLAGSNAGGTSSQAGSTANAGKGGNTEAGTGSGTSGTGTGGTDLGEGGMAAARSAGGRFGAAGTSGGGMAGGGTGGGGTGGAGAGGASGGGAGGAPTCTPTTEVCDGLDNDCDKAADQGQTCADGCTGYTYGGHSYALCGVVTSAALSLNKCQAMGLGLLTIQSQGENAFITSQLKGSSWLGASDLSQEGRWVWYHNGAVIWNDGEAVDDQYQNWSAPGPNNNGPMGAQEDCAVILSSAATKGQWNDIGCDFTGFRAACESLDPVP